MFHKWKLKTHGLLNLDIMEPCLLKKNAFNVKMYIENTYTVRISDDNMLCKGKSDINIKVINIDEN